MMGGRLERSVDEVSELVTSRPSWMLGGDPLTFNEEQLREYREYSAREAAAIEERLKRKGIMVRWAVVVVLLLSVFFLCEGFRKPFSRGHLAS
jgi:hypothetical protein